MSNKMFIFYHFTSGVGSPLTLAVSFPGSPCIKEAGCRASMTSGNLKPAPKIIAVKKSRQCYPLTVISGI